MKLREIVNELIERKFNTQTALAEALNPLPEGIERAKPADVQRMASAGRNQEKQFAMIMKMLPLCDDLGIDPARELEKPSDEEVLDAIKQPGPTPRSNAKRRKKGHEAATAGAISTRRAAGGSRKIR